ncbi:MAG TPA: hypothetical protein VFI25_08640 [Planctomycetota bacterium]|jgi:hypothetical protein|nr:hypothetical protein [Planctomycetota bacterium]
MRPAFADRIGVQVHGVTLNLRCSNPDQLAYVRALLGDHVREPWERPDLEVAAQWLVRAPEDDLQRPVFDVTGLDAFGKRMHVGEDSLVWTDTHRDPNLQLRFRRLPSGPAFDVAYQYRPSGKKLAKYPDFERKKFFDLMRYLVWFPIAWHLRRTRGWDMIHASAVRDGERGILIAGPGGAGKTTTSIALAARAGMTLLTENLVFCDGERIYPVYEPIRLTDESLELLGDAAGVLRPLDEGGALKKKTMFVPPADPDSSGVRPALVFLTRFSSEGFARVLPPDVACGLIRATNQLTLELNDFYWYAAALDLLFPGGNDAAERVVESLTRSVPCYSLGIDRSAGVGAVVDQVLACLRRPSRPALKVNAP